ncbi:MAG: hypothetical protein NTY76_02635 [Candidatus Omnitrophica bacterium]|nr:hypothetical protein [Candidatus Omnitrophota bacterium]
MAGIKEILLDKFTKAGWYLKDPGLPHRQAPARINFCIHTEMLYDEKISGTLLGFSRDFTNLTGKKIAVCVSTPHCPAVKIAIDRIGMPQELIGRRIADIAKFADIGYHGHFYLEGRNGPTQVSGDNYDKDVVRAQIRAETGWLKDMGIAPKIYIGGWWFLTEDIVLELERAGILVDLSVRKGKLNTFGGRYLDDGVIPEHGRQFILPPSKNIVEIESVFGPIMPAPIMKGHLSRYLDKNKDEGLSFVFPLHDWDVPKHRRNIWSNVKALQMSGESVVWMDILDMREERHHDKR